MSAAAGVRVLGVGAVGVVGVVVAVVVAGVVEVAVAGVAEVAAEVPGVVEAVGLAGLVEGARVAVKVELAGVEFKDLCLVLHLVEVMRVDSSTSHVRRRLSRRSSFVSGLPGATASEEEVAASTSGARVWHHRSPLFGSPL
ncbi:unnamed protein product [Closterium sp. NIES-65]|nr:unnamed protein product [Closterium sp. NIES-65]